MPVVAVHLSSENIDTAYDTASENTKPNPENHPKAEEEESKVQQMFYPMLLTMKIFGLYFPKRGTSTKNWQCTVLFVYSVIVLMCCWLNIAINIPGIKAWGSFDDIIVLGSFYVWKTYCAFNILILFLMCMRKEGWKQFFEKFKLSEDFLHNAEKCRNLKKCVYLHVVICWIVVVSNICILVYNTFTTHVADVHLFSLGQNDLQVTILKCVHCLLIVYYSAAWITTTILVGLINTLMAEFFNYFNQKLEERVKNYPSEVSLSLGVIREEHQELIANLQNANTLLSLNTGYTLIFNVVIFCGTMYGIIYRIFDLSDTAILASFTFWQIVTAIKLFVVTATCAKVKTEVR